MVLGVQNVQNARGRHGCVEHMVAPQASEHHGRPLRVSAQVERSMGGGSAGSCFADVCWAVSGAVLRG